MTSFEYQRPGTVAEASELLRGDHAVALAGGTDLLVAIRHRALVPEVVVDLKAIEDVGDEIEVSGDRLVIGGRVVMTQLARDRRVRDWFPALVAAAGVVGSIQIRNRATLVGNLCNASPAADTAPALLAYGASVTIGDGQARRSIPLEELFVGPGATVLGRGELVTSVEVPIPTDEVGSAFARVTRRRGVDLASVNLACVVDASGRARFGLGAVGPTPLVAESTVDSLATEDGLTRLLEVTSPISDVRAGAAYRGAMLRVHTRRALQEAIEQLRPGS